MRALALLAALLATGAAGADPATELAQQVYDRPDGRDSAARGEMVLEEEGQATRRRELVIFRKEGAPGEVASLIRFLSPPDITDTALLTADRAGEDADQWLYLPALGKARRIASSRRGGHFVSSDIYYEDLRDRPVDRDVHRIIGTGLAGKVNCRILESVPRDPDNSTYSKRVSWIDPETLLALRVDFFRGGPTPIKRLVVSRYERIQGYWTATDTLINDLRSGHTTRLRVERIVYDRDLPDSLFSRRVLEDPVREHSFRP